MEHLPNINVSKSTIELKNTTSPRKAKLNSGENSASQRKLPKIKNNQSQDALKGMKKSEKWISLNSDTPRNRESSNQNNKKSVFGEKNDSIYLL